MQIDWTNHIVSKRLMCFESIPSVQLKLINTFNCLWLFNQPLDQLMIIDLYVDKHKTRAFFWAFKPNGSIIRSHYFCWSIYKHIYHNNTPRIMDFVKAASELRELLVAVEVAQHQIRALGKLFCRRSIH